MADFEMFQAVRRTVRLRVMFVAPSGGGKTESSLRVATGMCRVVGGKPALIDTQDQAAAWYADRYDFNMIPLAPPHNPDRFLAAVQFAVANGAKVVVVDTLSDEHEGEGGVLELHDTILDQLTQESSARRGEDVDPKKLDGTAWRHAKDPRKRLIRGLRFVDAHIIFTVRAKEQSPVFAAKARPGTKTERQYVPGWVAVTDDDFLFECPIRMMMLPMSNGVPCWNPVTEGEKKALRRPAQFDELLRRFEGKSLCEDIGAEMARWAMGDSAPAGNGATPHQKRKSPKEIHAELVQHIKTAPGHARLEEIANEAHALFEANKFTKPTFDGLMAAIEAKRETLAEGA